MRPVRFFIASLLLAAASVTVYAGDECDIDISVSLSEDGTATIREVWSVDFSRGTEWYLDRSNLGDMRISNFSVRDGNGKEFLNEGQWNVNRSREEKAGRCGIVSRSGGCELCWGPGSYGLHRFIVEYDMSNAVRAMDDFDLLHIQFVTPGIKPRPQNVKVSVSTGLCPLADENAAIWAFGYEGNVNFEDGAVVARTQNPFTSDANSVILLIRFNKGIFNPRVTDSGPFQTVLDNAFEGSAYKDFLDGQEDEKRAASIFAAFFAMFTAAVSYFAVKGIRKRNMRIFGVRKLKEIGYVRSIPFNGNLFETAYVLSRCNRAVSGKDMAGALILRMVNEGALSVSEDAGGKVLITFTANAGTDAMPAPQKKFYGMLKAAAGEDGVLQHKEFSRWSRRNAKEVFEWLASLDNAGAEMIREDNFIDGREFTRDGKMHARSAVGFRNYLKDFTIIKERKTAEVALWRDYIVFAALLGIADKVAKELKDIDPKAFEANVGYDYPTINHVILFSNRMGSGMMDAVNNFNQTSGSVGGHGGSASFGGGGGFHGGGFGGGAR